MVPVTGMVAMTGVVIVTRVIVTRVVILTVVAMLMMHIRRRIGDLLESLTDRRVVAWLSHGSKHTPWGYEAGPP